MCPNVVYVDTILDKTIAYIFTYAKNKLTIKTIYIQ